MNVRRAPISFCVSAIISIRTKTVGWIADDHHRNHRPANQSYQYRCVWEVCRKESQQTHDLPEWSLGSSPVDVLIIGQKDGTTSFLSPVSEVSIRSMMVLSLWYSAWELPYSLAIWFSSRFSSNWSADRITPISWTFNLTSVSVIDYAAMDDCRKYRPARTIMSIRALWISFSSSWSSSFS